MVTSVPSDSPDDFAALRDLKKKQASIPFMSLFLIQPGISEVLPSSWETRLGASMLCLWTATANLVVRVWMFAVGQDYDNLRGLCVW